MSLRRGSPRTTQTYNSDALYPATGDQLAPEVQKAGVDSVPNSPRSTDLDPSSASPDRASDERPQDNEHGASAVRRLETRDRLRAMSQHSLLWPDFCGVALFLVLLPTAFIITIIVYNRPLPPPPRAPPGAEEQPERPPPRRQPLR